MAISIRNIVLACPGGRWVDDHWEGRPRELATFYAELLGMQIIREDWLVIASDEKTTPRLAFGEGPSDRYEPPRWKDPEHPQQLHLDISVADLDAADRLVVRHGARRLQGHGKLRTYADPVGHPFCLYADQQGPDSGPGLGRLRTVVLDCFSPRALAGFYASMLDLPDAVLDTPELVVLPARDPAQPMLAFQHSPSYRPPRWPDPTHPQQLHLDLDVEDGPAAEALALRLGAMRLSDKGGSCPVYADPAAHPFCICAPGE
jgi:hypothetical protein